MANWMRWIQRFRKPEPKTGPSKTKKQAAIVDPEQRQRDSARKERAVLEKRRQNMIEGANRNEAFKKMCAAHGITVEMAFTGN
jgi:hypothetical protein